MNSLLLALPILSLEFTTLIKLFQTRIFSYTDTQRHYLGPNYQQLPANAPKCAHHNHHHEGFMHSDEEVNYFPSKYDPCVHAEKYPVPPAIFIGKRDKCCIEKENNFKQAGERYRSWSLARQEIFIHQWIDALSDPRLTHEILSIWISYWSHHSSVSVFSRLILYENTILQADKSVLWE